MKKPFLFILVIIVIIGVSWYFISNSRGSAKSKQIFKANITEIGKTSMKWTGIIPSRYIEIQIEIVGLNKDDRKSNQTILYLALNSFTKQLLEDEMIGEADLIETFAFEYSDGNWYLDDPHYETFILHSRGSNNM